jgi:hypothetical protein
LQAEHLHDEPTTDTTTEGKPPAVGNAAKLGDNQTPGSRQRWPNDSGHYSMPIARVPVFELWHH